MLFIGLQYHVLISVMGCVYVLYTAAYLELKRWWSVSSSVPRLFMSYCMLWIAWVPRMGAYERFKWNCVALRKSSDNQKQHLFLGQRRISEIGCEYDCHHSSQKRILAIRIILENLTAWGILLRTVGQICTSLYSCLLVTSMKQHLRHVHKQGRNTTKKTMTCNVWYPHS